MFTNFDITPCFLFTVLLASNMVQPSKTQACQPSCQNGGTCINNNECFCPPGLTGPTCTNVDCDNYPCLNGGTCIRGSIRNQDTCQCPDGFVLPFCTTSCTSCFNGGTCSNGVCSCDSGFVGPTCEKAIFAYLNPLAVTVSEGNSDHDVTVQVCRQPDNLQITLSVYTIPRSASSGSDYENIPFSQDVTIPFGQVCTTETVTIKADHMFEQTKEFSLVLLIPGMVQQILYTLPGNTQTTITIMNDDPVNCDLDRPCFNGGTCRPSVSQNPCTCPGGFVEPFCTTSCITDLCQNGGTCIDDVCSCQPGFTGPTCQSAIAVYLSPLEVSVTEGNTGNSNVRIHLCRQQSDQAATVTVFTSPSSATSSFDFVNINTAVTVPSGHVCAPLDISIVSDMIIEPTEIFRVAINPTHLTSTVHIVPRQGVATVTIIDIDDTEPPVISNCPFDRLLSIATGTSSTNVVWAPPTATDNSGDVTLTPSHHRGDTFSLGQTTVTYTARDGAGNIEQCQFVITVIIDIDECSIGSHICDAMTSECMNTIGSYMCDCKTGYTGESYSPGQQPTCEETELPIIFNCPDDITVTAPVGAAATVVSWTPPVAFDTSGTVTLTSSQNPGDSFSFGSTEVIYTAIDGADNMASDCKFTVTVVELPSIRDPPTELTRTTTSVTITWRPWDEETDVGDPPVVVYIPYYKMNPSQDWMNGSRIQADQTLQYTASSLESDRNYTFSVAAVREGERGEGPRGPAVTIKTLCIDVVPQMVTTTLTATNDVTVTWQLPMVQCSTGITQFTIYYEIEGDVSTRQQAGTADPSAESFTVDGSLLKSGTTYSIPLQ